MRAAFLFSLAAACGTPATSTPSVTPSNEAAARRVDSADLLAYLPGNADLVMKFDVEAMRKSPLWAKHGKALLGFIAPSFAGCGYDPTAEMTTVMLGIPLDDSELGIFVLRGLDRDKTLACLRTSTQETRETATFDGEYVTLNNKSGARNIFTFVDAKTMVMQGSKAPTKESLRRALEAGVPLREDGGERLLADFTPGAAMSVTTRPGAQRIAQLVEARVGIPASEFQGNLTVTDVVSVRGSVTLASAEVAKAVADGVKPQLAQAQAFLERYDVHAEENRLVMDVVITEAQIEMIVRLATAQAGH